MFVLWDCRKQVCAPTIQASVNFCEYEELYLCYFLTNLFQTWIFCQFKGALRIQQSRWIFSNLSMSKVEGIKRSIRFEHFSCWYFKVKYYNLLRKIIISIFVS